MRAVRNFLIFGVLFLVACAGKPVIEGDTPQAHAADAIARVEIVLTKGYRFVADQAAAGVLLKSELKPIVDTLDQAAKLVDEAKALYSTGVSAVRSIKHSTRTKFSRASTRKSRNG
jgi:hypothetical protein